MDQKTIKNVSCLAYILKKQMNKTNLSFSLGCSLKCILIQLFSQRITEIKSPIDEQLNEIEYTPHQHYLFFLNSSSYPLCKFSFLKNLTARFLSVLIVLQSFCPSRIYGIPRDSLTATNLLFFLKDSVYSFITFPSQKGSSYDFPIFTLTL